MGLATEWNRTEMFRERPKRGYRQKEQCANNQNRSAEQETEGRSVVTQSPQAERNGLLCSETRRHGNWRNDRQEPADENY